MVEEQKTATLTLRLRPSIKALALACAAQDDRSLTQWLERLIAADATRRGVKAPKNSKG